MFTAYNFSKTHHFDVGLERKTEVASHCLVGNTPLKKVFQDRGLKTWSGKTIRICNRMRPSRIKDKFSRVFSKFSQNCPSRVATRAICENFENTSENLSLILRGLNAITCL